jgi:alkyl hydroperoxide reductase subunit AhpC
MEGDLMSNTTADVPRAPHASHAPKAVIGRMAPDFTMPSTKNLTTLEENVALADYRDRWLVLVFYPLDFTVQLVVEFYSQMV